MMQNFWFGLGIGITLSTAVRALMRRKEQKKK
jgi:hypothetical protein